MPQKILLGDLKPAGEAEQILGKGQISSYMAGIRETKNDINKYLKANPEKGHPSAENKDGSYEFPKWNPSLGKIKQLQIPKLRQISNNSGANVPLGLYDDKLNRAFQAIGGLKGKAVIYKHPSHTGIWVYEFIPFRFPKGLRKMKKSKAFENAIKRLNKLKRTLRAKTKLTTSKKKINRMADKKDNASLPNVYPSFRHRLNPSMAQHNIQRSPETVYDPQNWQDEYQKWKKEVSGMTGVGLKAKASGKGQNKTHQQLQLINAVSKLKDRTGLNVPLPFGHINVKNIAKNFRQLRHWTRFGILYSQLRNFFGTAFSTIVSLFTRIKNRISNPDKVKAKPKFGSGTFATVLKVAFKVIIQFLKLTINQVYENLKRSLATGAQALIKDFFSETFLKKYEEDINPIQDKIKEWINLPKKIEIQFRQKFSKELEVFEAGVNIANKIKKGLKTIGNIPVLSNGATVLFSAPHLRYSDV